MATEPQHRNLTTDECTPEHKSNPHAHNLAALFVVIVTHERGVDHSFIPRIPNIQPMDTRRLLFHAFDTQNHLLSKIESMCRPYQDFQISRSSLPLPATTNYTDASSGYVVLGGLWELLYTTVSVAISPAGPSDQSEQLLTVQGFPADTPLYVIYISPIHPSSTARNNAAPPSVPSMIVPSSGNINGRRALPISPRVATFYNYLDSLYPGHRAEVTQLRNNPIVGSAWRRYKDIWVISRIASRLGFHPAQPRALHTIHIPSSRPLEVRFLELIAWSEDVSFSSFRAYRLLFNWARASIPRLQEALEYVENDAGLEARILLGNLLEFFQDRGPRPGTVPATWNLRRFKHIHREIEGHISALLVPEGD